MLFVLMRGWRAADPHNNYQSGKSVSLVSARQKGRSKAAVPNGPAPGEKQSHVFVSEGVMIKASCV